MLSLTETENPHTSAQLFAHHLEFIGKDIQAWINLFTEDAVIEFPYASALGSPERLEGKAAIYNYMKYVPGQMQNLIFTNVRPVIGINITRNQDTAMPFPYN
jgi:uncharacterized protein